jgi:DNA-binding response OmpR family regulator
MAAKILLVDDNEGLRDSVRETMKMSDHLLVEAVDCESALALLACEVFDLVLVDITLPDKSGFEILKYCREKNVACKVIVITGTTKTGNEIKSATLGARDYITKPYDPGYLLKSIDHVLSDQLQPNLKLLIVKGGEFIVSTPSGELDMNTSAEGLAEIAELGSDLQNYVVLIDLRDVKSRLSTSEIYQLATELVKYGETFYRKTAVLARADEDFDQATFFETVARNRGFRVRAFTVFEDSIVWLSRNPQPVEEPTP